MLYGRLPTTRRSPPSVREVERQRIGFVQREPIRRESLAQPRGEIAVDLDRRDASGAFDQRAGQRAETRPDFDDVVAGLRSDRVDDARDVMRIGEEILAEALARLMPCMRSVGALSRIPLDAASSIARSTAATRLPDDRPSARARASAARSSAVPWSTDVRMNGRPSVTLTPWPKLAAFSTGRPWS